MSSRTILITAGEVAYVGGTVTETGGQDISGATFELNLGSDTDPGKTWYPADFNVQGNTTADRVVKLLVSDELPATPYQPGTYWAWVRVTDSPEVTPIRVQGPIILR